MLFPGFPGIATAIGLFAGIWFITYRKGKGRPAVFDPQGQHGEFGKNLLHIYLDIAKTVLGLATGSIVLLVGAMNFGPGGARRSLAAFASPLFLVAMSIIYGVLFMILLVLSYEHHLHHPNQPDAYNIAIFAELGKRDALERRNAATAGVAKILAGLARYHAARQIAAVDYNLYKMSGSVPAFDDAITNERKAIRSWREIVVAAGDRYIEDMYFGTGLRGFPHHWKDELPAMDKEFADLLAERKAAEPNPDAHTVVPAFHPEEQPPLVSHMPSTADEAIPGADLTVRATVKAPEGVRWIRLRYRHANQKEDYETLAMTQEGNTDVYSASIPGAFITPQWDLMYYFEVVDGRGTGRIYPDLEQETPYVMQRVRH